MRIRLLMLVLVTTTFGALTAACDSDSISSALSGPKIEVVGQEATSESELFGDYKVIVKCRYLNKGSSATITAKSEVNATNGSWTKRRTTTIASNQEREVVFEFAEVDYTLLGDNSFTYGCGWET